LHKRASPGEDVYFERCFTEEDPTWYEDEEATSRRRTTISFGEMIGCDNDKCEIEWFHFECIGLTTKPKGKWFCPNCRHPDSARIPKAARAISSINSRNSAAVEKV
uniref:PHD-type domain-containing protein n=1 Tax=Angiostrongylus costaricensis TaxID=334426 RepID=A0A0R3PRD3_ANGCS